MTLPIICLTLLLTFFPVSTICQPERAANRPNGHTTCTPAPIALKKQVRLFFQNLGWSAEQAAGIVGNLWHESELKPTVVSKYGNHRGVAQWDRTRYKALCNWAAQNNLNPKDIFAQLEFVHHELTNDEQDAGQKLKRAKTVEEATKIFCTYYERAGLPMLRLRISYAKLSLSD